MDDESRNFIEEGISEETIQPVLYKTTETIRKVISSDLDTNLDETLDEPELIQKEIYEKKIEAIWPANTDVYNNKVEDDDDDDEDEEDDDHEIEEAKMIKIQETKHQIRRRPITQQLQDLSPPSNNITSSHVHPNVKKYNLSYILKVIAVSIVITLFLYSQLGRKPSFLRNFADTTNSIFKEIDSFELPDVNTINDHAVTMRRAANTIHRSPIFKSHGIQIATGLRDLGDTIRDAGQSLRNMYSKGSSVHTSFDIEIEAMVQMVDRLDSHHLQGENADYFKKRINALAAKIKDFRQSVEKAHNTIIDAEQIKLDNEGNIEDGFREAEKFRDNEKYSADISKARNELAPVDDIFNHLRNTADQLEKMRIVLKDHEDKLIAVSDGLGDEGVKVTKSDIKYLQRAIDHSKASRDKFNKFAQISD